MTTLVVFERTPQTHFGNIGTDLMRAIAKMFGIAVARAKYLQDGDAEIDVITCKECGRDFVVMTSMCNEEEQYCTACGTKHIVGQYGGGQKSVLLPTELQEHLKKWLEFCGGLQ